MLCNIQLSLSITNTSISVAVDFVKDIHVEVPYSRDIALNKKQTVSGYAYSVDVDEIIN